MISNYPPNTDAQYETRYVHPDLVHETYQKDFEKLSPNSRRIISPLLLEDIWKLCERTEGLEFEDLFDREGLLTQKGYTTLIAAEPDVILPEESFHNLIKTFFCLQLAHYGESGGHAYHNVPHDFDVTENGMRSIREIIKTIKLPLSEIQIYILAHFAHDLGHCGRTLRQLDPETDERIADKDRYTTGLSNEAHSVALTDQFLKAAGFSIRQRLVFQGMVMGTTFFDIKKAHLLTPEEKPIPHTLLERMLSINDLAAGTLMGSEDEFLDRSLAALFDEKPKKVWPKNIDEWIAKTNDFFQYFVALRMTNGDKLGEGEPLHVARILYGKVFDQRSAMFNVLADKDPAVRKVAKEAFAAFLEKALTKFQPYFDELAGVT